MIYKFYNDNKDVAIVVKENEDIMKVLAKFAKEHKIGFAKFYGIGAYKRVVVGSAKDCKNSIEFVKHEFIAQTEDNCFTFETLSFIGSITWNPKSKDVVVHAHTAFSDKDTKVYGGHVFESIVGVTFEIYLRILSKDEKLFRSFDNRFGFPFWNFN